MKYALFFGETEKRILAAETPKEVMQIAWQAGVLLPKKAVMELFREVKKYRQEAGIKSLDEKAMEAATGGTGGFQAVFCRYGLHMPQDAPRDDGLFVCSCCGQTFRIVPGAQRPE